MVAIGTLATGNVTLRQERDVCEGGLNSGSGDG